MKMSRVGYPIVWAALISAFAYAATENELKISVRVLNIPPLQSVTWGGDDGTGKIAGGTVGGDLTSAFPDGVVLIQCDTPSEIPAAEIKNVVREKIFFNHLDELKKTGRFQNIGIELLGVEKEFYEIPENQSHPAHYWIMVNPIDENDDEIVASIVFRGGFKIAPFSRGKIIASESPAGPRWTKSEAPVLLDQTVGIRRGKTLLVGFPPTAARGERSIGWRSKSSHRNSRRSVLIGGGHLLRPPGPPRGIPASIRIISRLNDTQLAADLFEGPDGLLELLPGVGGRDLNADARLALGHDGEDEADDVDAFLVQFPGHLLS